MYGAGRTGKGRVEPRKVAALGRLASCLAARGWPCR